MLTGVRQGSPLYVASADTCRAAASEQWQTGVNETTFETRSGSEEWRLSRRPGGGTPYRVEAISWELNLAPAPADRSGQPSSACKFVLIGLANHAGPDGTGAFRSVATLIRYTGLSERTVRTCLDRLQAEGTISPCNPDIVTARIKRADCRPQGWDLNLSLVCADPDDVTVAALEYQFPGLGVRLAAARATARLIGGSQPAN